jgi:hypothetical protein
MDDVAYRKKRMLVMAVKRTASTDVNLFYELHDARAVPMEWVSESFKTTEVRAEQDLALQDAVHRKQPGGLGAAMILLYEVGPDETRSATQGFGDVCACPIARRSLTPAAIRSNA